MSHPTPPKTTNDRNFDDIAEHFAHKVYGGLKGQIRLAVLQRDLADVIARLTTTLGRPLRILDVGAGLGQVSLSLAQDGHDCTLTDISSVMLERAKQSADELGVVCRFMVTPYQDLPALLGNEKFDLILCHALLEWVDTPQAVIEICGQLLSKQGMLSLCFYNPIAPVYRNLLMGNFNYLNNPKPADKGSLTPNYPVPYETVLGYLTKYQILHESGIRVFYDYTSHKKGGLANPQAVIDMELKYSTKLPYRLMGRYLHVLATRQCKL